MLILTPKGDQLGVAQAFLWPLKETNRGVEILTPKKDRLKTHKYDMQWVLMT